jgi:hypothetical protein
LRGRVANDLPSHAPHRQHDRVEPQSTATWLRPLGVAPPGMFTDTQKLRAVGAGRSREKAIDIRSLETGQ